MRQHVQSLLVVTIVGLTLSGCAGQFVRRPPQVTWDPANGVMVTAPTIGEMAEGVLESVEGPVVYWHPGGRDYEYAPNAYDLEHDRVTNGRYRANILHSIVPNGIVGTMFVKATNNPDRVAGPSERNRWSWSTKNHYDGAWRHYQLWLRYTNSQEVLLFKYSVRSSPNPRVSGP